MPRVTDAVDVQVASCTTRRNAGIILGLQGHSGLEHAREFHAAAEALCVHDNVEFQHTIWPGYLIRANTVGHPRPDVDLEAAG